MPLQTLNIIAAADVSSRLSELGFPQEVLTATIEVWIAGMNSGTPLHAENFAGTIAWHEAIRTLRQEGLPYGLEKLSREGVQLCVCPSTGVAVAIAQGDARTGDTENLHLKPSTKYPRGPVSRAVLTAQLPLFPTAESKTVDPYEVWLLLLRKNEDETRVELSLPALIHDDGVILDWRERIFLGVFSGNPSGLTRAGTSTGPTRMLNASSACRLSRVVMPSRTRRTSRSHA